MKINILCCGIKCGKSYKMKKISFRINESTLEELTNLKKVYKKRSISNLLDVILEFLDKNEIDLSKDFNQTSIESLYFQNVNLLSKIDYLNNNIDLITTQNDKNTNRIIKIMQAQERDVLLPILRKDVKEKSNEIIKEELQNNLDIKYLKDLPKDESLIKIRDENHLLKDKISYLEKQISNKSTYSIDQNEFSNSLNNLKQMFSKSKITNNYTATLSESDFNKIFGNYVR